MKKIYSQNLCSEIVLPGIYSNHYSDTIEYFKDAMCKASKIPADRFGNKPSPLNDTASVEKRNKKMLILGQLKKIIYK